MKRMLLFLAVAFAMSAIGTSAYAQSGGVVISGFRATAQKDKVQLVWAATEDPSFVKHIVEHSLDRINFNPIGEVPAIFTGAGGYHRYGFLHTTPGRGRNYYRLNLVFGDGRSEYSVVVGAVVFAASTNPTLGSSGSPTRPLVGADEDQWNEAIISDIYGRPIMRMSAGQSELDLEGLPSGIYILNARYSDGWQTSKFVVNNKY